MATCKATFDYAAENGDELSFDVGDIITIKNEEDEGWWVGELNGKVGWFPANFVEKIKETKAAPPKASPKPPAAAGGAPAPAATDQPAVPAPVAVIPGGGIGMDELKQRMSLRKTGGGGGGRPKQNRPPPADEPEEMTELQKKLARKRALADGNVPDAAPSAAGGANPPPASPKPGRGSGGGGPGAAKKAPKPGPGAAAPKPGGRGGGAKKAPKPGPGAAKPKPGAKGGNAPPPAMAKPAGGRAAARKSKAFTQGEAMLGGIDLAAALGGGPPPKKKPAANTAAPKRAPKVKKYKKDPRELVRALYDSDAEIDGELALVAGETIAILEDLGDWWKGVNEGGEEGVFPKSYVEPLPDDEYPQVTDSEGEDEEELPEIAEEPESPAVHLIMDDPNKNRVRRASRRLPSRRGSKNVGGKFAAKAAEIAAKTPDPIPEEPVVATPSREPSPPPPVVVEEPTPPAPVEAATPNPGPVTLPTAAIGPDTVVIGVDGNGGLASIDNLPNGVTKIVFGGRADRSNGTLQINIGGDGSISGVSLGGSDVKHAFQML